MIKLLTRPIVLSLLISPLLVHSLATSSTSTFPSSSTKSPTTSPSTKTFHSTSPSSSLLGIHSPDYSRTRFFSDWLFAGRRGGHAQEVVYSTDFDWIPAWPPAFGSFVEAGFDFIVRVDYARPDGSAYAKIIGNEMNMLEESKGFPNSRMEPSWAAYVYSVASRFVRSFPGHEDDIVYLGPVSPGDANPPHYMSGIDFMTGMLKTLNPKQVNGVAVHAYGGWPDGNPPSMDIFRPQYQSMINLTTSMGFASADVLISEFCANADGPRQPGAAQFVHDSIADVDDWNLRGMQRVSGMIWFVWNMTQFSDQSMANFPLEQNAWRSMAQQGY